MLSCATIPPRNAAVLGRSAVGARALTSILAYNVETAVKRDIHFPCSNANLLRKFDVAHHPLDLDQNHFFSRCGGFCRESRESRKRKMGSCFLGRRFQGRYWDSASARIQRKHVVPT